MSIAHVDYMQNVFSSEYCIFSSRMVDALVAVCQTSLAQDRAQACVPSTDLTSHHLQVMWTSSHQPSRRYLQTLDPPKMDQYCGLGQVGSKTNQACSRFQKSAEMQLGACRLEASLGST